MTETRLAVLLLVLLLVPQAAEPEAVVEDVSVQQVANTRRGEGAPTWKEDSRLNRRIWIEGDRFLMGSPEGVGANREHPQHWVRLTGYYIQEHEVTNEEYVRFDPSLEFSVGEERLPVVRVSRQDASAYARWVGGRLPTEAEWEYAAKGGCPGDYCLESGRETILDELAWHGSNSGGRVHSVALRPANQNGLYDIYGNIMEWVPDGLGEYPEDEQVDPRGPQSGSRWMMRGGSWSTPPEFMTGAHRSWTAGEGLTDLFGLRVVWSSSGGGD